MHMSQQFLLCPLAAIGITGLYALWHRIRLGRAYGPEQQLRERITYMLWITAGRA